MQGFSLLALLGVGYVGQVLVDESNYDPKRDSVDTEVYPCQLPITLSKFTIFTPFTNRKQALYQVPADETDTICNQNVLYYMVVICSLFSFLYFSNHL